MTTIDFRSRFEGDSVALDVESFLDDHLPALLDAHRVDAGRATTRLGLPPLTLDVGGQPLTFAADGDRFDARRGSADALVVALDRAAFSDLMQDMTSTFGIQMSGRAQVVRGGLDAFLEWEPVLRCLLDGRPVHEPGAIDFHEITELRVLYLVAKASQGRGRIAMQLREELRISSSHSHNPSIVAMRRKFALSSSAIWRS
jgi:hypothetical protein